MHNFESLPWHDAQLLSLSVERKTDARANEVTITVRWPNDIVSDIHFPGCVEMDVSWHLVVHGPDAIDWGEESPNHRLVQEFVTTWAPIGDVDPNLTAFCIRTNNSVSDLTFVAAGFVVDVVGEAGDAQDRLAVHGIPENQEDG